MRNNHDWMPIIATKSQRTRFGEVPQYAEGLYDLNHGVYAWMVPNGSWGESNAGLIVGDGASLLVDTLWDFNYTRVMLDAMRCLTDAAPLKYVVNTHADGDHFWGNKLVEHAEIIASRPALEEMRRLDPKSMVLLGRVGKAFSKIKVLGTDKAGHWLQNMVAPYDFQSVTPTPATRTFEGKLMLNVGGREVQLIQAGPAHTQGDLMVFVPDAKTLFSGDLLFIGSTPVMWTGPVENWLAALDQILEMDVETIIPGHGPITDKNGVRQVKAYWEYMAAQVGQRYAGRMSAVDAAHDIAHSAEFAHQPFANWNSPERIVVSTHTIYRNLRGQRRHLNPLDMLNLMWKQAMLAHELPDAQPAVMRKR
jgi:glyoxylase-like metal-dependent hydrolase (beta-lactamase superfamily II)